MTFSGPERHDEVRQCSDQQNQPHGHRVPQCDRWQRTPNSACTSLLHAERDGEQPSHAGVDAVIGAQQTACAVPSPTTPPVHA